jgi:hypothetical protein
MKLKKMVSLLIANIRHDFGFYNPVWKWNDLPEPLNESYESLYPKLLEWEEKGYIKLFEENGEKIIKILKVPEEE